jgi:hypothetical protein
MSGGIYGLADLRQHSNRHPGSIKGDELLDKLSFSRKTLRYEGIVRILWWTLSII